MSVGALPCRLSRPWVPKEEHMPTTIIKTLMILLVIGFARPCAIPGYSKASGVLSDSGAQAESGTFRDPRDGRHYDWVRIGDQVWMAENLRFAAGSGSWCWKNDDTQCILRGRLYDWTTAQFVAPPGWHLPSDEEWKTLEMTLGLTREQADHEGDRGGGTGTPAAIMKAPGRWPGEYEGRRIEITNESGFSAVRTGFLGYGEFTHDGYTVWWTSSASNGGAWVRGLRFFDNKITRVVNKKVFAFAVRCVQDPDSRPPRTPRANRAPQPKETGFAAGLYRSVLKWILSRVIDESAAEGTK